MSPRLERLVRALLLVGLALTGAGAGAEDAPRKFYVSDIKGATERYIESELDASGVFPLEDDKTGEPLALRFVKIHDPVRVIDAHTYFACTDFTVDGEDEDKLYDIDFWLRPAGDVLEVFRVRVHKEPRHSLLYGWYKHPRYTFVNDEVVELYD